MEIKEIIIKIEESEIFQNWKNENNYLVHIFKMLDEANKDEFQVGYFNKENKMVTTFVYNKINGEITQNPESETFRKEEKDIEQLNLSNVKLDFAVIMHKIENLRSKKYSQHPVDKSFYILQMLNNKTIWNFTIITKTLSIINIKINAEDGSVIDDNLTSVFDFKAK
jgi:hypothetical protein